MDPFVPGCRQNHEKMKIEMNKSFWTTVKKAIFLARFVNKNHQNRNFMVSKRAGSIILYIALALLKLWVFI